MEAQAPRLPIPLNGLRPRQQVASAELGARRVGGLHPAPTLGTMPSMKKPRHKTARSRQLQAQDLAAVVGGTGGTIISQNAIGGGIGAHDNGVIHMQN
jgi:hypothetical protein